ncbi:MAG TPA: LysM peptidoglycan-binding domain-containing protein [Chthoniobacterales bacterium]|nr:LysM peptidoglycan-binding domain-containing protein [Chthoniobacterales bacterium]
MKRKFKMPNLLRFKRKKLRATAVRRPLRMTASAADYGDIAEPSMKLSRALLIVLLLHVVAVAGIIAFNAIKTRQASLPSAPTPTTVGIASADTKPQAPIPNLPAAQKTSAKPQPKVSDSGKVYVVAKGDNPVTIAKKFKVSYDDLLALNHIDDPRKLKIGQKLLIPEKASKKNQ